MPSLLGLTFLEGKKHSSFPRQQDITAEKASIPCYGVQNSPVNNALKAKKLETHLKIRGKASLEACYGASSKQEISATHGKKGYLPHQAPVACTGHGKKASLPNQASVTRKNFTAVKNVRQDEVFTNNEMLPGMEKAYKQFVRLYPEYLSTRSIDKIRAREYGYLDERGHVCLDYSGYGLFSRWQEIWDKASTSFGFSCISVNLSMHALYGEAHEGTVECDIKRMVSEFLNVQESEYAMVFTASRGSAFKLLGESYPFHTSKKLLSVYDYKSNAVKWIGEAAQKRGAKIMSAKFRWPSQCLWATDLKKKIIEKRRTKKEPMKGLFVFPVQSRVTGASYSYQWMLQAQQNGWDILLDASALGPNAMGTLGLCVFQPDFIVSSFFKVYGSDPRGFGCLMIKRTMLQRLCTLSAAGGGGMVRLVPTSLCPSTGQPAGGGLKEPVHGSLRYTGRRRSSSTCTSVGPSHQFCMDQAYLSTGKLLLRSSGAESNRTISSTSYKYSSVLTNLHTDEESEASLSKSEKSAHQGVQSLSSSSSVHGLTSAKPQQKLPSSLDGVEELQFLEGEKMAELGQNNVHQRESQSNPNGGMVFAGASKASRSASGRRGSFLLQPDQQQLHVAMSPSTVNSHKDLAFTVGELSAVVADDKEDDKDASSFFCDDDDNDDAKSFDTVNVVRKKDGIVCRGLQHAQELGLIRTNIRLRCLINWLIASMLKLRHPGPPDAHRLVQIYGPKVSYDRGAAVAFNLFDWNGNLVHPLLVQRLGDRNNISFGITTLNHIEVPKSSSSSLKCSNQINLSRGNVDGSKGHRSESAGGNAAGEATRVKKFPSTKAITISLCFLSNFQDVYRFWVFLANFLDADFVSKEVWLYRSLNQEMVVMGVEEPSKSSFS